MGLISLTALILTYKIRATLFSLGSAALHDLGHQGGVIVTSLDSRVRWPSLELWLCHSLTLSEPVCPYLPGWAAVRV